MSKFDERVTIPFIPPVHSRQAELEVELPGAGILGDISIFIRKCDAELNHLEQVYVTSQGLIVIVRRRAKVAFRSILFRNVENQLLVSRHH